MKRVAIAERSNWRARAAEGGFRFHTIDDAPYWDETAYYAFTLRQIEDGRAPDNLIRLDALGALDREGLKEALAIVRGFRDWITLHFRLQT